MLRVLSCKIKTQTVICCLIYMLTLITILSINVVCNKTLGIFIREYSDYSYIS